MRCRKGKTLTMRKGFNGDDQYFCKACGKVVSTDGPYFKYDQSKCMGCTKSETSIQTIARTEKFSRIEREKKHKVLPDRGYGYYI